MAKIASPERIILPDSKEETGIRPFVRYIPEDVIDERTNVLAEEILADYDGESIHLLWVALGGVFWAADLSRAIRRRDPNVNMTHDLLRLGSYGQGTMTSGVVRQLGDLGKPGLIDGNNVIIVDEVVESGLTIAHMRRTLEAGIKSGRGSDAKSVRPATVAVAALVDKPTQHNHRGALSTDLTVNYTGFEVPGVWLVGRGMDHEERGRDLDAIYRSATKKDPVEVAPYTMPISIPVNPKIVY